MSVAGNYKGICLPSAQRMFSGSDGEGSRLDTFKAPSTLILFRLKTHSFRCVQAFRWKTYQMKTMTENIAGAFVSTHMYRVQLTSQGAVLPLSNECWKSKTHQNVSADGNRCVFDGNENASFWKRILFSFCEQGLNPSLAPFVVIMSSAALCSFFLRCICP